MVRVEDQLVRYGTAAFLLTLAAAIVHIWTVVMAFSYKGWASALWALVLFLYAEGLWSYRLWHEAPIYAWCAAVWLVLYVGVMVWGYVLRRWYPKEFEEGE